MSSAPLFGSEICFKSEGRLDTCHKSLLSSFIKKDITSFKRKINKSKSLCNFYVSVFRAWESCDQTILSLLGFPTPDGFFDLDLSRIVSGIFGDFLFRLKSRFRVSKKKISTYASNQFVSKDSIDSLDMTGKYALVLWRDKIIGKKEVYLYALCTGMEDNPLGFYFKWLQYKNAVDQLDHSLYKDSEWKIIWLKNKLSDGDMRSLDTFGCIPLLTGYVQLN